MENDAFKIAGVRNLIITNYGVDPDLIDLKSLIDNKISMAENWSNIKPKVIILCEKFNKSLF